MEKGRSTEEIVYGFRDSPARPDPGWTGKDSQSTLW
jgi:hypothetical protein